MEMRPDENQNYTCDNLERPPCLDEIFKLR